MKQKKIAVLGSTGSIGTQTLEVAAHLGNIRVVALAARSNVTLLEQQIRQFHPDVCAVYEPEAYLDLKARVADLSVQVLCGMEGLLACVSGDAEIVVTSMVGSIGLKPTLEAIQQGKTIALANKETLVTAGSIVMKEAEKHGVSILPVDSEHSAIFQCLQGNPAPKKILLTASGGPFFGKTREELERVTVEQALQHPNWSMGGKITIDSATLMNKGLEVIEACWLFHCRPEQIEVLVHRESIIHSMVEFCDHSILAQLGVPDMKIPIQLALTYPERLPSLTEAVDFTKWSNLSFYKPDLETFACLRLAFEALSTGGSMPAVLNGANEVAVDAFLRGKIKFLDIANTVEAVMQQHVAILTPTLQDIFDADAWARECANHFLER